MKRLLLFWCWGLAFGALFAQTPVYDVVVKGEPDQAPRMIRFDPASPPAFRSAADIIDAVYGISADENAVLLRTSRDQNGMNHHRVQQTYLGRNIIGNQLLVHEDRSYVLSINGNWTQNFSRFPKNAIYTPEDAAEIAKTLLGLTLLNDPLASDELVYTRVPGGRDERFHLAHALEMVTAEDALIVYVDAISGAVLYKESKHFNCNTNGFGTSTYQGNVNLVIDNTGGTNHRLFSCAHPADIHTRNLQGWGGYSNYAANSNEITQGDLNFDAFNHPEDQSGVDVHHGMHICYAFGSTLFGRNSYDDAGAPINAYVGWGNNIDNAFWDGDDEVFAFGAGSGSNGPLVTLDIIGHEYWHAVTQYTAGLQYVGESGALNEAFSDIFGTLIEEFGPNALDWEIGEDWGGGPIRDMQNPNAYGQPDCYGGAFFIQPDPPIFDNGGVHFNSGIANHWFYLLTVGGSGTNDCGETFAVNGIGLNAAAAIAYRALTVYMSSTDNFEDARTWTIQAAEDFFGPCSAEYIAVINAWHAVCVGNSFQGFDAPTGLDEELITNCDATLFWDDMGSATYEVCYRVQGAVNWICTNVSITSLVLANLSSNTPYEWRVRGTCGGTNSPWSAIENFTTLSNCPMPLPTVDEITVCSAFFEWPANGAISFELRYRECGTATWTVVSTTNLSLVISNLDVNTCYEWQMRSICSCGACTWTKSQTFTTLSCPDVNIESIQASACEVTITVTGTNGARWLIAHRVLGNTGWNIQGLFWQGVIPQTVSFGANPNTTYEVQLISRCFGDGCQVDQYGPIFQVTTPPLAATCEPVTNLTVDMQVDVGVGSPLAYFQVHWDPPTNGNQYELRFRTNPLGAWNGPYTLNDPEFHGATNGNACYLEVEVRAICGCMDPVQTSAWVSIVFDEDDFPCPDLTAYNSAVNCNGWVRLESDPRFCYDAYEWRYRRIIPTPIGPWTVVQTNWYQLNINPATLDPGATYEWQVRLICTDGTPHPWGPVQTFVTAGECSDPTGLTATQLSTSSAQLSWTGPNATVTGYQVEWRVQGAANWNGPIGTSLTTITLTGLTPNVTYEWRVRALCSPTPGCPSELGDWSDIDDFILTECNHLGTPVNLACTVIGSTYTLRWDAVPGAPAYLIFIQTNDPACCPHSTTPPQSLIPIFVAASQNPSYVLSPNHPGLTKCFSWEVRAICEGNWGPASKKLCSSSCPIVGIIGGEGKRTGNQPQIRTFDLLELRPNPVENYLLLDLWIVEKGPVHAEVWDMVGKQSHISYDWEGQAGENHFRISGLEGLAKGVYILHITHQGQSIQKRFIKQ